MDKLNKPNQLIALKSNQKEENVIKFSDLLSNMKSREDYYLVESEVESLIKEIKVGL